MKKKLVMCMVFVCVMSLAGCSAEMKKKIEDSILIKSAILEDGDYLDYQKVQQDGTWENSFIDMMLNPENVANDDEKIRITFGSNSNIQIEYFYDSALTKPVDISNCYLSPNDSLYASVGKVTSPYANLYTFSGYRIVEYDSEGNKLSELGWNDGDENHVFQIPMGFNGCEISVVPVGKYEKCVVKLSDYTLNDSGEPFELGGTWIVNGNKITSDEAEVSPVGALSVQYEYDENKYFFVSSYPVDKSTVDSGVISFYSAENLTKELSYSVELHPYLSARVLLDNKVDGSYEIVDSNGNVCIESVTFEGKKEFDVNKLRFGDKIIITTNKKCNITTNCDQMSEALESRSQEEYIYTLMVSSEHMPTFNLVLNKSIGTYTRFAVVTADMSKQDLQYVDGIFKSEHVAVNQIVSLKNGIQIKVEDNNLGAQEAYKFVITKTDKDNKVTTDTKYIVADSKQNFVEVIGEPIDSKTYYKDITVSISKTNAEIYRTKTVGNGTITLKAVDNGQVIPSETVVDGERKVLVTINPYAGYYVAGNKDISGDSYMKEMTYAEYSKNLGNILEQNPIKNYIDLTLDVEDPYGICTFLVDGKATSGTVKLKHHQKLVISYKITNDDYQLAYESEGWLDWTNAFKNKKEAEENIELKDSLDGATLNRSTYFTVKKKGE